MTAIAPTQSNVLAALRAFLLNVLPAGTVVLAAQQNRVAEPQPADFVIMTAIRVERLETNIDSYADVKFTGSISDEVLTVTAVDFGEILPGATLFGVGVAANSVIGAQRSGDPGGAGTYALAPSQTLASTTLSSGAKTLQQNAKFTVQLDFHSADLTSSDAAQTVATTMRDEYATDFFAGLSAPLNGVVPLYADDPRQMPFLNDQQQYEWRWVLEATLQVNQVVSVPQQFADSVSVTLEGIGA